ncbi:hypothetical protein BVY11_04380 [Pseudomonas amygdali pv. morsprunorum]|nr:hypothetical protein BVY11_04380 [Pseudomonas amygdali pv. morsprunorum]PPS38343.1 hypothetical protein BVY12_07190 [Pseudomonas amygdali pv. morsprunorum]
MRLAGLKARLTALSARWSQFHAGLHSSAKLNFEGDDYLR